MKKIIIVLIVPILFLIVSIWTLSDYGINWDEPQHFNRGQAYLHYFLTGKTNYLDLAKHETLDEAVDFKDIRGNYMQLYKDAKRSNRENEGYRRSYYQSDIFNFEYFKEKDSGHPPANGILAAFSNFILYQQLGIAGDLESYHLFEVLTAFLIVLAVGIFTYYLFGVFPSIVASASLALYPLFFAESHFNIKDPVLSSFFGLTIILLFFGVIKKRKLLIIISSIFAGLSLGTKFNALFIPVITLPWLLMYWWKIEKLKKDLKTCLTFIIYPFIAAGVFYLLWPYLWFSGWEGLMGVFNYYVKEGISSTEMLANYKFFDFNFFPLFWIITTTPLPILILSTFGICWFIARLIKEGNQVSLLVLLWLLVPIVRVSLPNTAIYGGIRHIMEFVPVLAITSGAGSYFLLTFVNKQFKNLVLVLIFSSLVFVLLEMVRIHPNENVYFNQLVGGLGGAYSKNIPYSGNSFGNAYQQGIVWLNKYAETGAKVGLPIGGTVNLPRENLRRDLDLANDNFSGVKREGEYEMEMSHSGFPRDYFAYSYLDKFLEPVYQVKVDGVAILKIWKNDSVHLKVPFSKEINFGLSKLRREGNVLEIDVGKQIFLTGVYVNYTKDNCRNKIQGFISVSADGINWFQEPEPISYPQMSPSKINAENRDFFFLFAAKKTRYIRINLDDFNACLFNNPVIEVRGIADIPG